MYNILKFEIFNITFSGKKCEIGQLNEKKHHPKSNSYNLLVLKPQQLNQLYNSSLISLWKMMLVKLSKI